MRKLLFLFSMLVVWRPPRLRLQHRALDTAISDPFNLDAVALLNVAVYIGGAVVVAVLIAQHVLQKRALVPTAVTKSPLRWYFLYGVMAVASGFYSSAPVYTFYFAAQLIVTILVLSLLEESQGSSLSSAAVMSLFCVYLLQGVAIAILYFVAPNLVGDTVEGMYHGTPGYRVTGGIFEDYGASALLSGLFFLTVMLFSPIRQRRLLAAIGYVISWLFLFLAKSRSVTFTALLFPLIMISSHRDLKLKMRCAFGTAVFVTLCLIWSDYFRSGLDFITRDWEGISTMTGRTVAFSYLMDQWKQSPVWGLGYAAGTRVVLMEFARRTGWGIGAAHDAFSKVLVELGIIGAIPLTLAFVFAWKELFLIWRKAHCYTSAQRPVILQLICLMLWVTTTNFVSSGIAGASAPFVIVLSAAHRLKRMSHVIWITADTTLTSQEYAKLPLTVARPT